MSRLDRVQDWGNMRVEPWKKNLVQDASCGILKSHAAGRVNANASLAFFAQAGVRL